MKKIVVYAASSSNLSEKYLQVAFELGRKLAKNGYDVIYGGGKVGLMGELASGVMSCDGRITGIIPEFMIPLELGNYDITELKIVSSMHERQATMIKESDAVVVLPGGSGTMLEFLEVISWKKLGLCNHPVVLLNTGNYYDELLNMLYKSIKEGFMDPEFDGLWHLAESVDKCIDYLKMKL